MKRNTINIVQGVIVAAMTVHLFAVELAANDGDNDVANDADIVLSEVTDDELADMDLEDLLAIEVVETVSLREQSIHEAPSSVTVITREQIETSCAKSIAELLRLVPGMHVMQLTGNTYSVGLRGISRLMNGRVLILVDGQPYKDFVSNYTRFTAIPFHSEDIERIEVIRGPGSVIYGAGALSGVVNFITKKVGDGALVEATASGGVQFSSYNADGDRWLETMGESRVAYNRMNEAGTVGVRIGANYLDSPLWPNPDLSESGREDSAPIHGPGTYALTGTVQLHPSDRTGLRLMLTHSGYENVGFAEMSHIPMTQNNTTQHAGIFFSRSGFIWPQLDFSLSIHGMRAEAEFNQPDVNADSFLTLASNGMAKFILYALQKRNITTLAYENALARGYRFFFQPTSIQHGVILNNDTFLFDRRLVLSLGGRYDHISNRESDFGEITYRVFSYRAAAIWRFNNYHALRATGSSSFRPPSSYESFINVQPNAEIASLPDGYPSIRYVMGNPRLAPERLQNIELGYQGMWHEKLQGDISVFGQDVENLTENRADNTLPVQKINRFDYQQTGMELGLVYKPSSFLSTYLNYSYVFSRDKKTGRQVKDFPSHIGGWGSQVNFSMRSRLNVNTYWVFDYTPSVSELIPNAEMPLVRHEKRTAASQLIVDIRICRRFFDNKVALFMTGKNLVAALLNTSQQRMYPLYSVQPVGTTIFMGMNMVIN